MDLFRLSRRDIVLFAAFALVGMSASFVLTGRKMKRERIPTGPVAFGVIGLAGCFHQMKDERVGLAIGTVVGCMGRLLAAVASGVIFFAEYAPAGMNPIVYSLGYNATYMVPECIICAIIACRSMGTIPAQI